MNRSYNTVTSSNYIDENIIKDVVEKYKELVCYYEYRGLHERNNLDEYYSNTNYMFSYECAYDIDVVDVALDLSIKFPELFFQYTHIKESDFEGYTAFISNGKIIFDAPYAYIFNKLENKK